MVILLLYFAKRFQFGCVCDGCLGWSYGIRYCRMKNLSPKRSSFARENGSHHNPSKFLPLKTWCTRNYFYRQILYKFNPSKKFWKIMEKCFPASVRIDILHLVQCTWRRKCLQLHKILWVIFTSLQQTNYIFLVLLPIHFIWCRLPVLVKTY